MLEHFSKQVLVLTACVWLFAGCACRPNLLDTGVYQQEIISHSRTSFGRVWASEDKGGLKVSGELHLNRAIRGNIPKDVNVVLVDRSGAVITAQKVPYYPRTRTGWRFHREARFSVRFPEMPPAGTMIRMSNLD